eukprot:1943747-Pleurochrysis_carterae.AAC.1
MASRGGALVQGVVTFVALESVHLRQDLVECLLSLVVAAAARPTAARCRPSPADSVDLVDEDDTWGNLLRLTGQRIQRAGERRRSR